MEEKEFLRLSKDYLNVEGSPGGVKEKIGHFSGRLFNIVKLFLGLGLLPFVYATVSAFLDEMCLLDAKLQQNFWAGVITLLIIHLFIWEPAWVYAKGYKLLEAIFNFFKPLVKVAPYLLPIYSIVLFILYSLFCYTLQLKKAIPYFIFLLGFSMTLHLVFSAKSIHSRKSDFLKANYIFGFSFICLTNISLLALFLSLIFDKFSFVRFANRSFQIAQSILEAVFKQLFS